MSELMPQTVPWDDWARSVKVDLAQLRQYAEAVYAQTDEYLAGLTPEDLEAEVDFAGKRTIGDASRPLPDKPRQPALRRDLGGEGAPGREGVSVLGFPNPLSLLRFAQDRLFPAREGGTMEQDTSHPPVPSPAQRERGADRAG